MIRMEATEQAARVKVFDFFSGCGGASCGFQAAGLDVVFALDCDREAKRTFTGNFPKAHFELGDIQAVRVEQVQRYVEAARTDPVLFCGCAPCQPFTKQNTTRPDVGDDDRVPLLLRFATFVEACVPDLVFVENVPGLQDIDSRSRPFHSFLKRLDACGYHVDFRSIRLAKYGVPQNRRRLILVASRHGAIKLPAETHGPGTPTDRYETVRDWIAHLPPIQAGEEHPRVPNHRAAKLSCPECQADKGNPWRGRASKLAR